ncbi:MAG TPA: hypothetical protein VK923_08150 [Euzebyales bacterium]|nr:hypothetical protein [Euzebyales bacterium]
MRVARGGREYAQAQTSHATLSRYEHGTVQPSFATFDPLRLLETLVDDVEFIVIGQITAVLQGHPETIRRP